MSRRHGTRTACAGVRRLLSNRRAPLHTQRLLRSIGGQLQAFREEHRQLRALEGEIKDLREENRQLRESAKVFAELSERLSARLQQKADCDPVVKTG